MAGAYDEIVSLGCDCTVTYNLRRTFGLTRAYPFDWWVTSLQALSTWLRQPSAPRLYDPDLLEPVWIEGVKQGLRNTHYGIELRHEFPRNDGGGGVSDDWADRLDKERGRTEYLHDRFMSLPEAADRVLFVRSFKDWETDHIKGRVTSLVAEIRQSLSVLLPGLDHDLLLVDCPEAVDLPGVSSIRVDDPRTGDWRGTRKLWARQLRGAGGVRRTGEPAPDDAPASLPSAQPA